MGLVTRHTWVSKSRTLLTSNIRHGSPEQPSEGDQIPRDASIIKTI